MFCNKTKEEFEQEVVGGQVLDQAVEGRKQVKGHDLHLDLSWSRTCPHVLPSGERNPGYCQRWENHRTTLIWIIIFILLSFISSVGAHGDMSKLHWESEAAVIQVLNGTKATFPWIHSSSTYVGITWYYIGTPETPRRDILQIYTEYKINAYGPKQDRLGFQNQTGSAILTLKDVTEADEGDYQAQVIRSLNGSSDQVENIKSITRLKIINVEDLTYTLGLNGTKNSSFNFSVDPAETRIYLPLWGSTVTVPDRFNITVNVSQAGAPQPTIRIWKVVNGKNPSQPICDSFFCNRYVTLTSDDAREAQECLVVIVIDFRIQNLKPLIHTFNVSMETAPEGFSWKETPGLVVGDVDDTVCLHWEFISTKYPLSIIWLYNQSGYTILQHHVDRNVTDEDRLGERVKLRSYSQTHITIDIMNITMGDAGGYELELGGIGAKDYVHIGVYNGTELSLGLASPWRGWGIGLLVILILLLIGALIFYLWVRAKPKRKHWFQRKIRLKPLEEESLVPLGIVLRSKSQHPETDLEMSASPLSPDDINVHFKSHSMWAEYSFDVPVDFKEENSDIFIRCLVIITALLNTSGGVLTLISYLEPTHDDIKHWQETFIKYALPRLSLRILRQHLVIDIAKGKMQIRVKKGPHLVTLKYNMVTWDVVAAKPARVTDFEEVVDIVECGEEPRVKDHVTDDSGHLQHKPVHYVNSPDFTESSLNSIWKDLEPIIQSLANSGGGTIDIRTIRSKTECSSSLTSLSQRICSDKSESQDLKRWFTEKISEMVLQSVIWGTEGYSPAEGRDWDLRVLDNKVLRIFVYECPGGVFMRCPDCYVITDGGSIRALSFKEWRNRLLDVTGSSEYAHHKMGVLEDFNHPSASGLSGSGLLGQSVAKPGTELTLFESDEPDYLSPVVNFDEPDHSVPLTDFDEPDSFSPLTPLKSLEEIQSKPHECDKYSTPWSVVNSHWEKDKQYLAKPSADEINHITSVLNKSSNIIFLPKSEQMNESSRETHRQVVQKINSQLSQGVCLTTPSWLTLIRNSQKYIHPEKQEILIISKTSGLYLCNMDPESLSNFHEKSQKKNFQERETKESEHLMDTARILKKYIVGIVASESKDRRVNPAAFTIRTPVTDEAFPWREDIYLSIIRAMVHLVLLRNCLLRTCLIEMCTKTHLGRPRYPEFHLSPSQSAVLHSLDTARYIFVDGAPGSGKTLLALHICQTLRSRSNVRPNQIYYICPSSPLAEYVEYKLQGSCQIEHCPDLTKLHSVSRGLSKHAEDSYAIIDDSQNYVESNTHWSRVFNDLRVKQLVILVDSRYQNYTDQKEPQNLMSNFIQHVITKGIPYGIFQLGEAHRSTGKIFSFIRSSLGKRETGEDEVDSAKYESSIECAYRRGLPLQGFVQHDDLTKCLQPTLKQAIPGGDVNFHEVPPGSDMSAFILLQVLKLIKRSQHGDTSCVFNFQDIAVLFDNKVQHVAEFQARELIVFLRQKGHLAQKADEFPVTKIIVDTLDRFQGLESKVVMFVLPPSGYGDVRHVHDVRYRLLVTSRASHRVDFLYQGDHAGMMKKWLGFAEGTPRQTAKTPGLSTSALIHH